MNDISISWDPIDPELHRELIQYVYGIIGCMQYVHRLLGPGMPDFIYQEGVIKLSDIFATAILRSAIFSHPQRRARRAVA